jgi:hypothetical protein
MSTPEQRLAVIQNIVKQIKENNGWFIEENIHEIELALTIPDVSKIVPTTGTSPLEKTIEWINKKLGK